jgi:hypothetical protein
VVGPCCRCLWIFNKLFNSTGFSYSCSSWALWSLSLSSFRLLTMATKSGGVYLSLWPSYSLSLRCEVSSMLHCTIHIYMSFNTSYMMKQQTIISHYINNHF